MADDNLHQQGSDRVSQAPERVESPNVNTMALHEQAAQNASSQRLEQSNPVDKNGQIDFDNNKINGYDNNSKSNAIRCSNIWI